MTKRLISSCPSSFPSSLSPTEQPSQRSPSSNMLHIAGHSSYVHRKEREVNILLTRRNALLQPRHPNHSKQHAATRQQRPNEQLRKLL